MWRRKCMIVGILMILALLLPAGFGCSSEPHEVLFGCALGLTGDLAETGNLYKEGYDLWKDHVNAQGGIQIGRTKYEVGILYYDDESDPQKTASLVETLITEDEVDFLLGPYGSSCTLEAAVVADEHHIPMVQGGGAADEIFTAGFEYTFGLLTASADYFESILQLAASFNSVSMDMAILSASDLFSLSAAEGARDHAESLGLSVVSLTTFDSEDELPQILSDLSQEGPDIVLLSAHFEEALPFVAAAKEAVLDAKMLGISVAPSDPAFVQELGADAEYIYGTAQWVSDLPYYGPVFGRAQDYADLFYEEFGEQPDYHAAAASACGVAYQLALEEAASLDAAKVRDALASLDTMTFYGRIKFDEQGRDSYNPMVAVQVQDGEVVAVWPRHLGTGAPIYPTPSWQDR